MNTETSSHDSALPPAVPSSSPTVLAQVPWLAPVAEPAAAAAVEPVACNTAWFEPHSVVASADVGVAPCAVDTSSLSTSQWRIDRPVSPSAAATSQRPPTSRQPAAAPAVVAPPPRQSPVGNQQARLRFDPPEATGHEHPAPHAAENPRPASVWHAALASIDSALRQYHRVILLAALLTAAGLMILVLDSQHPIATPDSQTELAPSLDGLDPLDGNGQPTAPVAVETQHAEPPSTTADARGPQSDRRRRVASNMPSDLNHDLVLEPLELPSRQPNAEPPTASEPKEPADVVSSRPAESTTANLDSSEASDTGDVQETAQAAADEATAPDDQPQPYPSTGAAEFVWEGRPAEEAKGAPAEQAEDGAPSIARLSQEILSPNQQTRK